MEPAAADGIASVRKRIAEASARAGRRDADIRLIAVTKQQNPAVLGALVDAGITDFGENRVEHLQEMHAAAPAGSRFHYIGRVQGRQLAKIAPMVESLHSLCEEGHVERLARACGTHERRLPVFLQVNTGGEAQKAGLEPHDLPRMLELVRRQPMLEAVGLMCMAPDRDLPGVDEGVLRRCFAGLRELGEEHGLSRLSMGMSKDFEAAIEEGATDLRIGSALFQAPERG